MPIQITATANCIGTLESRLDAFRKTIKDGEGYTINELAQLPQVNGGQSSIRLLLNRKKWFVVVKDNRPGGHNMMLLVNPKTLAKHAHQS